MHSQSGNLGKQTQPAAKSARVAQIYHTPTAASNAEIQAETD